MKKSFTKIVSVIFAMIFALSALACAASAETTVIKDDASLNNTDTAGDTINKFEGARDIYLVLDISGSMRGTPIEKLKDAAKQFCATMLDDKDCANRIAIVTYGTDVDTYSFTTDYAALANTIDSLDAKGSTAMYDALMAVKNIDAKYGNEEATKHVVVMADGLPNEGAVLSDGRYDSKDSSTYYKHANAVFSTAAGMWPDYLIYSIGFFHNLGGSQLKFGKVLMKDIQNALYLEVFDPDQLEDAFKDVADNITGDGNQGATTSTTVAAGSDESEDVSEDVSEVETSETTTATETTETTTATTTTKPATTKAPETTTKKPSNVKDKIDQSGVKTMGISAAAGIMIAGIAIVATKKREDI